MVCLSSLKEGKAIMKRVLITIAVATAALLAGTANSQSGYGPGMGGHGYGPGMQGYGSGMMGGPGMMGGYGPGMMDGYGPGMGGGGGGPRALGIPDLSAEQRTKIKQAQQDFWKKQWPLMQQMHSATWDGESAELDDQGARKNYEAVAGLHKQMFENQLELRKRIDGSLTPQQRESLRRGPAR
jgi:Spy/CpxP family protein refolding chaperone